MSEWIDFSALVVIIATVNTYQQDLDKVRFKRWREVIGLREQLHLTYEEIGQRFGMSKAAAFSLYNYAMEQREKGRI